MKIFTQLGMYAVHCLQKRYRQLLKQPYHSPEVNSEIGFWAVSFFYCYLRKGVEKRTIETIWDSRAHRIVGQILSFALILNANIVCNGRNFFLSAFAVVMRHPSKKVKVWRKKNVKCLFIVFYYRRISTSIDWTSDCVYNAEFRCFTILQKVLWLSINKFA